MKLLFIIIGVIFAFAAIGNLAPNPESSIGIILSIALIPLYFLPSIISYKSKHHNKKAILILNIFLGWTLLGWIIALIWANTKKA